MNLHAYGSVSVLVLAGGRGERLDLLTKLRAKPAVPFGGGCRIIDFVLSNCFHSGMADISILTQYLPRSLEDHVGFGRAWDLDRVTGGLNYLHPFRGLDKSNWYGGTANALYENMPILAESAADHFLILSGDHIYRMDYRELVAKHEASMAQVTVAVRPVAAEQAHHFGIFERDEQGRAVSFEEKPARPRSNLASMGIYVIRREHLLDLLSRRGPSEPELDFGRDLVPEWVESQTLALYPYEGYWLDVGTLESYFQAHCDLLGRKPVFRMDDPDWPIITRAPHRAPMYMAPTAKLSDSLISEGCRIYGEVERSILAPGVRVEEGARVVDSIVMEDAVVGQGSSIRRGILDKRVRVGAGCRIGGEGEGEINREMPKALFSGLTLLAKDSSVPAGFALGRNERWAAEETAGLEMQYPSREVPDGASVLS